jgi:hypothetical protein
LSESRFRPGLGDGGAQGADHGINLEPVHMLLQAVEVRHTDLDLVMAFALGLTHQGTHMPHRWRISQALQTMASNQPG